MKTVFYFLGILLLGIISCDDEDKLDARSISAKLNAASWSGRAEMSIDQANDTLTVLGVGQEQVLVFKIKLNGEGVYKLSGRQAIYYTTVGGDAVVSEYLLDPTVHSQVTITAYDAETNLLKGNFEVSLLLEWSNPEGSTEVLRFTKGQFKGAISQYD